LCSLNSAFIIFCYTLCTHTQSKLEVILFFTIKTSMCGKIKPVLKERGSKLPRQKSNCPTWFFCHPQIVPTEVSQDNTRKTMGIKQ
jgi:hypothetical protein